MEVTKFNTSDPYVLLNSLLALLAATEMEDLRAFLKGIPTRLFIEVLEAPYGAVCMTPRITPRDISTLKKSRTQEFDRGLLIDKAERAELRIYVARAMYIGVKAVLSPARQDTGSKAPPAYEQIDPAKFWRPNTAYFIRTLTQAIHGVLVGEDADAVYLRAASWIADTGRYSNFLHGAPPYEVEPYPETQVVRVTKNLMTEALEMPGDFTQQK